MNKHMCICGHEQRWHTLNRCMRCEERRMMHSYDECEKCSREVQHE